MTSLHFFECQECGDLKCKMVVEGPIEYSTLLGCWICDDNLWHEVEVREVSDDE